MAPKKLTLEEISKNENTEKLDIFSPKETYPSDLINFVVEKFKKNTRNLELIDKIRIASSEMIANGIEWGNRRDISKKLKIYCLWKDKDFYFIIQDEGKGFDLDNPVYQGAPIPEGSLGIAYTKQAMDLVYNFKDNASYVVKRVEKKSFFLNFLRNPFPQHL